MLRDVGDEDSTEIVIWASGFRESEKKQSFRERKGEKVEYVTASFVGAEVVFK